MNNVQILRCVLDRFIRCAFERGYSYYVAMEMEELLKDSANFVCVRACALLKKVSCPLPS